MRRVNPGLASVVALLMAIPLAASCSRRPNSAAQSPPLDAHAQSEILKYVDERYPQLLVRANFGEADAARVSQSVRAMLVARPPNEWAPSVVLLAEKHRKDGTLFAIQMHWLMWRDRMPPNITLGKGDRVLAKITYPDGWWVPVPVLRGYQPPVQPIAVSGSPIVDAVDVRSKNSRHVVDYLALISRDDASAPGDWWIRTESGEEYDFLVERIVLGAESTPTEDDIRDEAPQE